MKEEPVRISDDIPGLYSVKNCKMLQCIFNASAKVIVRSALKLCKYLYTPYYCVDVLYYALDSDLSKNVLKLHSMKHFTVVPE